MVRTEGQLTGCGLGVEQAGALARRAVPARSRVQQVVDAAALAARRICHVGQGRVLTPRRAVRSAGRIALAVARGQVRVDESRLAEHRQREAARRIVQVAANHRHAPVESHLLGQLQHLAGLAGAQAAGGVARGRAQPWVAGPVFAGGQMRCQEVDHPDRRIHPHQVRRAEPVGQHPPARADHLQGGQHHLPVEAGIAVPDDRVAAGSGLAGDQAHDALVGLLKRHHLRASGLGELSHEQRYPLTHPARIAVLGAPHPVQDVLADKAHGGDPPLRGRFLPSARCGLRLFDSPLPSIRFPGLRLPGLRLPNGGLKSSRLLLLGRTLRSVLDAGWRFFVGISAGLIDDRRLGLGRSLLNRREWLASRPIRSASRRDKDQDSRHSRVSQTPAPVGGTGPDVAESG